MNVQLLGDFVDETICDQPRGKGTPEYKDLLKLRKLGSTKISPFGYHGNSYLCDLSFKKNGRKWENII